MRIHARRCLTALSLAAVFALPVLARNNSATVTIVNPATIADKQLKAGTYKLEVESDHNHLKVVDTSSNKAVAEVPCQWIELKAAPDSTEVTVSNNQVTQIAFKGNKQAIKIGG